ncbi:hypothetical protein GCM10027176_76320 [Actinoallomurus bryophytorum]
MQPASGDGQGGDDDARGPQCGLRGGGVLDAAAGVGHEQADAEQGGDTDVEEDQGAGASGDESVNRWC